MRRAPRRRSSRGRTRLAADGVVSASSERTSARRSRRRSTSFAGQALRVLAFATRELDAGRAARAPDEVERELVFLGLVGLQDPPRPEVTRGGARGALGRDRDRHDHRRLRADRRGDRAQDRHRHRAAPGVAHRRRARGDRRRRRCAERLAEVRDGRELLFARVAPADKLRVVDAFKALDEIVAVTGDGVNDAPALSRADIGVAMGVAGTDVAKEAAVMVLLDDSFATIVKAIERGRAVYNNIRRFLVYLFTHNIGELFPIVFATLAGLPVVPLNALQVLSIDLGSDVLPALALGAEEPEPGLLEQPPRPAQRAPDVARRDRAVRVPRAHPGGRRHRELLLRAVRRRLALGRPAVELRPHLPPGDHDDPGRRSSSRRSSTASPCAPTAAACSRSASSPTGALVAAAGARRRASCSRSPTPRRCSACSAPRRCPPTAGPSRPPSASSR